MTHAPEETREIYCLKCRRKTTSDHLTPSMMSNGKSALSAVCKTCGAKTYTIVGKK